MSAHNRIIAWLQQAGVPYEIVHHQGATTLHQAAERCGIPAQQVARAVVLGDEHGTLLAVQPLNHVINFARLFVLVERKLEPVEREATRYIFPDSEPGCVPAIAEPFMLSAIVDDVLLAQESVYLEAGSRRQLLRLSGEDFRYLHRRSIKGSFTSPAEQLRGEDREFVQQAAYAQRHGIRQLRPVEGIRQQLEELHRLPAMHPMGNQLLQLYHDPHASIAQLVRVLETDPSISAQLLRNARSAYYNYPGELDTLQQAVSQVLGFDYAVNTALGITALRPFDLPIDGPLGMNSLWHHAIHCAVLTQSLSALLPRRLESRPEMAYLSALLHNFGFFVLGHLVKPEFFLLNRVVAANPNTPISLIEKRTLGISHTEVGGRLMAHWNMPEALQIALREHHNENYQGKHAIYPKLIMLSNTLLRRHGIGDGAEETPPPALLNALGLSQNQIEQALQAHMAQAEHLEELIHGMSRQAA